MFVYQFIITECGFSKITLPGQQAIADAQILQIGKHDFILFLYTILVSICTYGFYIYPSNHGSSHSIWVLFTCLSASNVPQHFAFEHNLPQHREGVSENGGLQRDHKKMFVWESLLDE